MKDRSNSIANALELVQSCTKPSIWCYKMFGILPISGVIFEAVWAYKCLGILTLWSADHGLSLTLCCYKKVNFLPNRHPIACPWGQGMGYLFWIQIIIPPLEWSSKVGYTGMRLSVRLSICKHNPVTTLLGVILLRSRPNLVGTYHEWKSQPSWFMGDVAR